MARCRYPLIRTIEMALNGKMQAYAEARAQGLEPLVAAAHAGYAGSGIKVTTSRIEARSDVQAEVRRLRKGGKPSPTTGAKKPVDEDSELEKWAMRDRYDSPLDLLRDVMNNPKAPKSLRYMAAKDALPYCHARKETSKKEEAAAASKKVAKGKFRPASRPSHLRAVN